MASQFRRQYDGFEDEASAEARIFFDPEDDRTRQEFKEDADINVILRKFGVAPGDPKNMPFGFADYTQDFQSAQLLVQDARRHLQQLPGDVIQAYGGVPGLMAAIARGDRLDFGEQPPVSRGGAGDPSPEPQRTAPAAPQEPSGGSKTTP